MADKKRRPKCSVCNANGHNKRHCPILLMEEKIEKNAVSQPVILVSNVQAPSLSPHVVDLKNQEQEKVWQGVPVWQEVENKKTERQVVDFADLIRKNNKERLTIDQRLVKGKTERPEIKDQQIMVVAKDRFKIPEFNIKEKIANAKCRMKDKMREVASGFKIKKFATSVAALLIIVTLPAPAVGYYNKVKEDSRKVVEESTNAFLALQSSTVAALNSNIAQAEFDLNTALDSFGRADSIIEREHRALIYVASALPVVGIQVSSRQHLLSAGHHLALGNTYLVKGVAAVQSVNGDSITDKLATLRAHLRSALPQYQEALTDLSAVEDTVLPEEYQQSFADFKLLYTAFVDDLGDMTGLSNVLNMLMGGEERKRYLLVFQNNNEIRPSGGFLGSFATIDVQKGKIVKWDVPGGGTYDLKGQLNVFVKPPLALQLVNSRWEFQDANWFPDFSATGQKIAWFYQHGRNATVDGVIAINATVLEKVLSVLGPITTTDNQLVLASTNAIDTLQKEVEINYDKEKNAPKEVIGELFSQFLTQFQDVDKIDLIRILSELNIALKQKEIQVYFSNKGLEQSFRDYGWTGEVASISPEQDYLMVVNANLQGQKSDAKVEQEIEHQAVVETDGSIVDTVFIRRRHTGKPGEIFYGATNIDYLRVYVPEGAELIEAGGFDYPPENKFHVPEDWYQEDEDLLAIEQEIGYHAQSGTRLTKEFGKSVFGNWLIVSPGETKEVYFTYRLPFKVIKENKKNSSVLWGEQKETSRYSLLAQKQSGINSKFLATIIYPDGWYPAWRSSEEIDLAVNGATWKTVLIEDSLFGVAMEKE